MTSEASSRPEMLFYVTGGTLPPDAASYVAREADHSLLDSLLAGEYCYVLNSRQMGKSSLCVRTIARLKEQAVTTVFLDLTKFGGGNLTAEQWYAGMLAEVGRGCGLRSEMLAYWKENREVSPVQRFFSALQEVALGRLEGRLVVFVDEIDVTLGLPFSTDEFFAAIRQCYVGRATDERLHRLVFCLLGTATPADLIQDTRVSPFNIGKRIELRDFTDSEAAPLAQGLGTNGKVLLARVLYWTGGHPYLTQRLCRSAAESGLQTTGEVDRLCTELFLTHTAQESDDNLAFVRNRLLKSEVDLASLLDLYAKMRAGKRIPYDEINPFCPVLRLSGVAKVQNGMLLVRNRIYAHVFDRGWVEARMPDAEKRRQQAAYRTGLWRATLAIGSATLVLAGLAFFAFFELGRADRNARRADRIALEAIKSQDKERLARTEADTNAAERAIALAEANKQRQSAVSANNLALQNLHLANERLDAVSKAQKVADSEKLHAVSAAAAARDAEGVTRHLLYIADINLAQKAYKENNAGLTMELLQTHRNEGMHNFEWRFLYHLCHERLLSTLKRKIPNGMTFSPDGRWIAAMSWDGVKIWDAQTGKERFTLNGHTSEIASVAFSPNGKRIVTVSDDQTATVWDATTGKKLLTFKGHTAKVNAVAFSSDGQRIVTGSDDKTARVWNATSGAELLTLKGHTESVTAVTYAAEGDRIITGSWDRTAKIWDAQTGEELHTLTGHSQVITAIAASPIGRIVATGGWDHDVKVWDIPTGKELFTLQGYTQIVNSIAFSKDGERLVTSSDDNTTRVWSTDNRQELFALRGYARHMNNAVFSPDGRRITTLSDDGSLQVWNAEAKKNINDEDPTSLFSTAFSPDGNSLATASEDKTARIWDIKTGKEKLVFKGHTERVTSVAFSPDGNFLATGSYDQTARIWDAQTGKEHFTIKGLNGDVNSVAFSPDGLRLITGSVAKGVILWDVKTGKRLLSLTDHSPYAVAFSPNGRWIVTALEFGGVKIWDAHTGKELLSLDSNSSVNSVAFSPDGRQFVTGNQDWTSSVWDAQTGKKLRTLKGHSGGINAVAFSPDGQRIVTGSQDKTAKVWDAQTGKELITLEGDSAGVLSVAFSPDGNRLVTTGWYGIARLWDASPVSAQSDIPSGKN